MKWLILRLYRLQQCLSCAATSCAHDCPEPTNNSECSVSLDNPAAYDDCIRHYDSIFVLQLNIQSKQRNSPAHVCCCDHTAFLWTEQSYAAAALVASSASSTGISRLPRILSVIAETPSLINTTKSPAHCMQRIRPLGKTNCSVQSPSSCFQQQYSLDTDGRATTEFG